MQFQPDVEIEDSKHIRIVAGVGSAEAFWCADCDNLINASDLIQSKYGTSCPKCTSRQVYSLTRLAWNKKEDVAVQPTMKQQHRDNVRQFRRAVQERGIA